MSCTVCLNDMCNGGCCSISYDDLQNLSYGIKTLISKLGDSYIMRLKEGHSCKPTDFDYSITSKSRDGVSKNGKILIEYKELKNLLYTIDHEMKAKYMDYTSCICNDTLCKIKDKVISILPINCFDECRKDIKIDSTSEQAWIESNPYCVSREKYEELLYRVCNDMEVTLTVVKKRCDLVFDMVKEYQSCDITYNLDPKTLDCKVEFDTIATKINCDITYDVYVVLRSCGITFDTVGKALECGITFDIDRENNCPIIVTLEGGYSLCDNSQDQNEQLRNIIRTFSIKE